MTLHNLLDLAALTAAILLFLLGTGRGLAVLAIVASGLQVAADFGVFRVNIARIDLGLVFAAVLLVAGVVAWVRSTAKAAVTAATVVAFVGLVQLVGLWKSGRMPL
jgi:hypothetical protein